MGAPPPFQFKSCLPTTYCYRQYHIVIKFRIMFSTCSITLTFPYIIEPLVNPTLTCNYFYPHFLSWLLRRYIQYQWICPSGPGILLYPPLPNTPPYRKICVGPCIFPLPLAHATSRKKSTVA